MIDWSTDDLQVLLSKGVEEGKILFLSLIAAPEGIHKICAAFPRVKVITSEIDEGIGSDYQVVPGESSTLSHGGKLVLSNVAPRWPCHIKGRLPCPVFC